MTQVEINKIRQWGVYQPRFVHSQITFNHMTGRFGSINVVVQELVTVVYTKKKIYYKITVRGKYTTYDDIPPPPYTQGQELTAHELASVLMSN